jgi:hypothetical protein
MSNSRKAIAIETAIYVVMVVAIIVTSILFIAIKIAKDDKENNDIALEERSAVDRIGESFVSCKIKNTYFPTGSYSDYNVAVNGDTLTVKNLSDGDTLLTVTVTNGIIIRWTY